MKVTRGWFDKMVIEGDVWVSKLLLFRRQGQVWEEDPSHSLPNPPHSPLLFHPHPLANLLIFYNAPHPPTHPPHPRHPPFPSPGEAWLHCKHRDENFPKFGTKIENSTVEIIFWSAVFKHQHRGEAGATYTAGALHSDKKFLSCRPHEGHPLPTINVKIYLFLNWTFDSYYMSNIFVSIEKKNNLCSRTPHWRACTPGWAAWDNTKLTQKETFIPRKKAKFG